MSVELSYSTSLTVKEVLDANVDSASATARTVTHNQFNTTKSLNGSSAVPVSEVAAFVQALSTGAATVDLTSLTGTNGASVDGTGLKVQALKVKNLGSSTLTITPGGSNPYEMFGTSGSIEIPAGGEVVLYGNENAPDISSTECEVDLSGSSSEESEWTIVMG